MHLFIANSYGADTPVYIPHDYAISVASLFQGGAFSPDSIAGMEGHTGSPAQVEAIEERRIAIQGTPFGTALFHGVTETPSATHRVLMEEIGHGLGAGTADDKGFGLGECYSGGPCYGYYTGDERTGGGEDQTPEPVSLTFDEGEWPIMGDADYMFDNTNRAAFSIEEVSTIDFEDIPSKDD